MLPRPKDSPSNTVEVLESLSQRIESAKHILDGSQENKDSITTSELQSLIKQMEGMVDYLREGMASIPPSPFHDHEEMRGSKFEASPSQETEATSSPGLDPNLVRSQAQLAEMLKNASKRSSDRSGRVKNSSTGAVQDVAQYVEPLYGSFFCPLTKKIMEDPVIIQSGATYERQAIVQWFERQGDEEEATCPATGEMLLSKSMYRNMALQAIIEEWRDRSQKAKIKVIQAALSLASSESMVMEALKDLKNICQRQPERVREVRNKGIVSSLVKFLEYKDSVIRHLTLEILQQLAQDDEGKELIGKTTAISSTVRMISSRYQPVKHAALLLLAELSLSATLSEKIGWVTGGVLMLIKTKYDRSIDVFASEAANQVLQHLAQSPQNIKCMAENGFLEPLLDNLVGGSENMKVEMAGYLAEVVLGHDGDTFIAKKASPTLIEMTRSGNATIRKAALKALVPISSVHTNAEMLANAGIAQIIIEEMFTRNIYIESSDALKEAAEILANLLESGLDAQKIKVTSQGHSMASDYVVSNIVYMLTSSNVDDLSLSLIRSITCLMKWSMPNILAAAGDSEVCYTLAEFINNPDEQLGVASIKLLIKLVPHMGQILVDRLSKIHGLPHGLVQSLTDLSLITEKQVLSVKLLATLPHENLRLNLSLLTGNTVETVIQTIKQIQQSGKRTGRYTSAYLEGLVGVLVRFTTTLYEPQMLYLAVNNDFTTIFKDLLTETSPNAEVKRLAATGLEKLSMQSTKLSKLPRVDRKSSITAPRFLLSSSSGKNKITLCPVHRGVCTAQNTFCLIVSRAVDALLLCLDQQNTGLIEAALKALSTLLDNSVDLEKSVSMLIEMRVAEDLMKLVKDHTEETLLQKAFWMIQRFLRKGGEDFIATVLKDKKFVSTVVNTFYHGDKDTKEIVEEILTHLRIMGGSTLSLS